MQISAVFLSWDMYTYHLPICCMHLAIAAFQQIMSQGHSRIPVYRGTRQQASSYILVQQLIKIDPDDCILLKCTCCAFLSLAQFN